MSIPAAQSLLDGENRPSQLLFWTVLASTNVTRSSENCFNAPSIMEKNLTENKSAERTQGGTSMAEHNTTFEVSSMTQLENAGNVKALANVIINGEIAVNGVKIVEGKEGLFTAMPSKNIDSEYVDIAHTEQGGMSV